jgi:drug/metabolite transporter (DMT)-like permease
VAAGLGSLAWAAVLSRVRAAVAALGLYVIPIGGAIASHIVLDEPLYSRHAIGAVIVVVAIVIARSST